jgi:hypothetical protein
MHKTKLSLHNLPKNVIHTFQYDDYLKNHMKKTDRVCGLEVTVPGYRTSDSGFDSRRYQIF